MRISGLLLLFTLCFAGQVGCATTSDTDKGEGSDYNGASASKDELQPFDAVSEITRKTIDDPRKAQRVLVAFNLYCKTDSEGEADQDCEKGELVYCPNRVRTLDNVCGDRSSDPSVVCRFAGDSAPVKKLGRIRWVAQGEKPKGRPDFPAPKFTVTFPKDLHPCEADSASASSSGGRGEFWSGSEQAASSQLCKLRSAEDFALKEGREAYIKYNIVGDERCDGATVLDPYFIVRE